MAVEWINETAGAVDEKLGLISVQVPFCITPNIGETKADTLIRALTVEPPDLANFFLPRVKRDVREAQDGSYKIVFTFDGKNDPDSEGEEYTLEGTTSEDPIESHPDIKQLMEKYNGKPIDSGKILFDLEMVVNEKEVKNPMHGVSEYLVPGLVWTQTFTARDFPKSMVRALGTIQFPPVGKEGQRPPTLEGKRNWMLVRLQAVWRGNVWKISRSWMLSGVGGWNPHVYAYT